MAERSFSGARVVVRGDSLVTTWCSGFADLRTGLRWTADTPTQVASISKQFVAVVALFLVDRGVLTLDDPVPSLLSGMPAHWRDVRVQHLLTHTSGLSHWCARPGFDPATRVAPEDRLGRLLDAPLENPPGEVWRYSSPGYIVLSAVLESVANSPYADLVHDLIIDRLHLANTTVGGPSGAAMARGYRTGQEVTPWDLHTMPGTGDICSSANDLARFVNALHSGTLLPPRAQGLLHRIVVPHDDAASTPAVTATGYGLGHFAGSINGEHAYLHPGDNPGYQALAAWLPETKTTVVALTNEETDDPEQAVADILAESRVRRVLE